MEIEETDLKNEEVQQTLRTDFSSENFKIEVRGFGIYGYGELKKLLKIKLKLEPSKIKASASKKIVYICFRNEEDRLNGISKLNGYLWKNKPLTARNANPVIDPMLKKRLKTNGKEENSTKLSDKKTALQATAPLANIEYDEQIKQKELNAIHLLKQFGNQLILTNKDLQKLVNDNQKKFNNLPCLWKGFKKSPSLYGYRNKNEFSVGKNNLGEKLVGFRIGSYADGSVEIDDGAELPHIPERVKHAAKSFENYVRISEFDVFNTELYTGQFRQFSVRYSLFYDEIMLIIGLHTSEIEDKLDNLKSDIVNYFTERDGKDINVTSLYIEYMNKRDIGQTISKTEHLYGSEHINDNINGFKFRISPVSFFQTNTAAAEILYNSIIELGAPDKDTAILDICCGTGTIGICFSKHCKQVFGVDIVADAIKDAEYNCRENNIINCEFSTGNCTNFIQSLVYKASNKNLLAIFDPPRAGLHHQSTTAIRNAKDLNRLIYIACSPKAAKKNWLDLAKRCSKTLKGNPFVPISAVAVDMFPHTNHYELAILFERIETPTN